MSDPDNSMGLGKNALARAMLQSARTDIPPDGARERAVLALSASLSATTAAAAASNLSATSATSGASGISGVTALKLVLAIVTGAVGVGVVVIAIALHRPPATQPLTPVQVATPTTTSAELECAAPEATTEPTSNAPAIAERRPTTALPPASAPVAPPIAVSPIATAPMEAAPDIAGEIKQLDQARAAVASDPGRAQAALDAYARRFPHGALGPESTLLRIQVLLADGNRAAAAALANQFLAANPTSPYAARVRSLLGSGNKQ